MSLYYLGNGRFHEQLADMRDLEEARLCLFCDLSLDPDHVALFQTPHWTVTPNKYPYRETALHLLLIPTEHEVDLVDLSEQARAEFWTALTWVRDHYGLTYYGLAARNGLCEFTGATIRHVHVHVVQGDVDQPEHQGVRVRLSSRPGGVSGDIHPDQLHPGRP